MNKKENRKVLTVQPIPDFIFVFAGIGRFALDSQKASLYNFLLREAACTATKTNIKKEMIGCA
jgi:hypothetical protein